MALVLKLRIARGEGEAAVDKRRGVRLRGGGKVMGEGVEIGGGRAVRDADDGEDLAVGLKVLPRARRGSSEDELEAEGGGGGIPGLVGEGGLLMLGVEGADGG